MNYITEKQYNTIMPNGNKEYFNNLNNEQKQLYLEFSTLYRIALNKYIGNIALQKYDDELSSSDLNFLPVSENEKDIYQKYSNLNYYYVRNNIYIERIPMKILNSFKNVFIKNNYELNMNISTFIEKTFKIVIKEDIGQNYAVNFGPLSSTFFAKNGSLVIGFRYDEFNLNGMSDEEWDINNDKQQELLGQLNEQLEKTLNEQLSMPVTVVDYDNYSVKAIDNSESQKDGMIR